MARAKTTINIKLDEGGILPTRAHETDAGLDLYSPIWAIVPANGSMTIDTLVHVELPGGSVGMIKSKSGLNVNRSILSEGVIDEGYTGSIRVKLYNHGNRDVEIKVGDKISQLVILPCLYLTPVLADEIKGGDRGDNGFGSTDRA